MDRPRLLVVDDDPYTRHALKAMFTRGGWTVSTAATVSEALARLGDSPAPRCMILDLNLPDGIGEVVLRAARARCPATRVVVCSGTDDPRLLARIRRLGPELLLAKPIEPGPLFRLCAEVRPATA